MKTKLTFFIITLLLVNSLAFGATNSFESMYKQSTNNNISLLFLQNAGYLTFQPTNNQCYQLTLSSLDQNLLYFSDQPSRIVGETPIKSFVDIWLRDNIKPNAAIHAYTALRRTAPTINIVMTLSQPEYNAQHNTLHYLACPLAKNTTKLEKHYYQATIFYDSYCLGCSG